MRKENVLGVSYREAIMDKLWSSPADRLDHLIWARVLHNCNERVRSLLYVRLSHTICKSLDNVQ